MGEEAGSAGEGGGEEEGVLGEGAGEGGGEAEGAGAEGVEELEVWGDFEEDEVGGEEGVVEVEGEGVVGGDAVLAVGHADGGAGHLLDG